MPGLIREYRANDEEAVVGLSVRAWAPVFASVAEVLGPEIFSRLHGDWRQYQKRSVRVALANTDVHVFVSEAKAAVTGFVAVTCDYDRLLGEIWMLAVDSDHQDRGTATALTEFATSWLRRAGMRVAMAQTGGDRGHAAARRVYERAGYTASATVQYFKAL